MTMQQLIGFANKITRGLPADKCEMIRVLFHNPTDCAVGAFEAFAEWDGIEVLDDVIQTAKALGIDNAGRVEDLFVEWMNRECSGDDATPDQHALDVAENEGMTFRADVN